MSKVEGFMVRIDSDKHRQLKELSDTLGLKMVDLGRIAIDGLLDYAAAHNGRLTLPLDFSTAWTQLKKVVDEQEHNLSLVAEDPTPYGKQPSNITDPALDAINAANANGGETNTTSA